MLLRRAAAAVSHHMYPGARMGVSESRGRADPGPVGGCVLDNFGVCMCVPCARSAPYGDEHMIYSQ